MKAGYKTTEFWLSVLPIICGTILALTGHDEFAGILLGGGAVGGANYARGRVELKKQNGG